MKPNEHVERVIAKMRKSFPHNGTKHVAFLEDLRKKGIISEMMQKMTTHLIENPEADYKVKEDGTLVIKGKL